MANVALKYLESSLNRVNLFFKFMNNESYWENDDQRRKERKEIIVSVRRETAKVFFIFLEFN